MSIVLILFDPLSALYLVSSIKTFIGEHSREACDTS